MAGGQTRTTMLLLLLLLLPALCAMTLTGRSAREHGQVTIRLEKWRGHDRLLCRFEGRTSGYLLRFHWIWLAANGTKHTMQAVTKDTLHRVRLGKLMNIGDEVYCEVSRAVNSHGQLTRPLRSAPLHLGVTWSTRQQLDGSVDITLSASVPLSCRESHPCQLTLRLQTLQSGVGDAHGHYLLLLDRCQVTLNCPRGICRPQTVTATINSQAGRTESAVTARIQPELADTAGTGPEWAGYRPPAITVVVPVSTPRVCQLIPIGYIIDFDDRRRQLTRSGEHVLYSSTAASPAVVISVTSRPCDGSQAANRCVCIVTVRVGPERVTVDVCPHPGGDRHPRLQRRSSSSRLSRHLHVLETLSDTAWLVTSKSGLIVRLHSVTISCGDSGGTDLSHKTLSVTLSDPSGGGGTYHGFCSGRGTEHVTPNSTAHRSRRSLPTQDHLMELPFDDLSDHLFSGALEPETTTDATPKVRPALAPNTKSNSFGFKQRLASETSDGLPRGVKGDPLTEEIEAGSSSSNPLSADTSGTLDVLTRTRRRCERAVAKLWLASTCTDRISGDFVAALTGICVEDKNSAVAKKCLLEQLPPLLEDRCRVTALSPPAPRRKSLLCPQSCNGPGCRDQSSYKTIQNYQRAGAAPLVTSVGQRGLCDLASSSCVNVPVRSHQFWPIVGLRCSVRRDNYKWSHITPATYRSPTEIQCHLPATSLEGLRHTAKVVSWIIQVSYNGVDWSRPVILHTFNGDCQLCQPLNGGVSCTAVTDSCAIAGRCYRAGDTNPEDPCMYCGSDQQQWTTRTDAGCSRGQTVTCQTAGPACQHGLCVEDSGGAICVCSPGYIGTHCQIREQYLDLHTMEEMGDEVLYGQHGAPPDSR